MDVMLDNSRGGHQVRCISTSMNTSVVSFFQDLGRKISQVSGDTREASFLFQRIAVTTQRFNSQLFRDSNFVAQDDSDA